MEDVRVNASRSYYGSGGEPKQDAKAVILTALGTRIVYSHMSQRGAHGSYSQVPSSTLQTNGRR